MLAFFILLFSFVTFAKTEFHSPFSQQVLFSIKDGATTTKDATNPEKLVKDQLQYLFGILNEFDSGIDFPNVNIKINKITNKNGIYEVSYQANGTIAWNKNIEIPSTMDFLLPKQSDEAGLTQFLNQYQSKCAKKPSSLATFWSYYRPHHEGCPLTNVGHLDITKVQAELKINESHLNNIEPNYRQIFDDNILEITTIMTKDDPTNETDISISDFQTLCDYFKENSFSVKQLNNECHSEGIKNGQTVKAHVYLIDNFNDRPDLFLQKLNPYFATSDIVTYNGHSGMGVNVESWMKLYPIPKNKYQIIFFNSCDTFGYFKNMFFDRVKSLNQVSSSSEYVDVILNATPNFFGSFASSNQKIVENLLKGAYFTEILYALPQEQHPLLLKE